MKTALTLFGILASVLTTPAFGSTVDITKELQSLNKQAQDRYNNGIVGSWEVAEAKAALSELEFKQTGNRGLQISRCESVINDLNDAYKLEREAYDAGGVTISAVLDSLRRLSDIERTCEDLKNAGRPRPL